MGSLSAACSPVSLSRARNPRQTPLYRLVEAHYEEVKGLWEERFERVYGFWRGFVDDVVNRYLDCGLFEAGFARVFCDDCHDEFLVALSCKGRGFCPSCSAKRAAIFAAFLREEVLEPVGHAQWVFSLPKMLRPYVLYHPDSALPGEAVSAHRQSARIVGITAPDSGHHAAVVEHEHRAEIS